jgi:acyl-[acyl carrier protein]--UDP-N-acetylglucosamine O-acyltransferase
MTIHPMAIVEALVHDSAEIQAFAVIGHAPESREYWAHPDVQLHQPFIAAGARVHTHVTVDAGLQRVTTIGERTWLGRHVHVGHDAIIGDDCELAPGAVVCGHAEIGDGVRVGVNACIRPFVKVGALARIGMGAVVIRDVEPGQVVAGNPAKPIRAAGQYAPPSAVPQAVLEEIWEQALAHARAAVAEERA